MSMAEAMVAGSPTSQAGPGDHLPSNPRSHPHPSPSAAATHSHHGRHWITRVLTHFTVDNNSRPGRGGGKEREFKWDQWRREKKKIIVLIRITSLKEAHPPPKKKKGMKSPGSWIGSSRSTAHVSRVGAAGWFPEGGGGTEAGIEAAGRGPPRRGERGLAGRPTVGRAV